MDPVDLVEYEGFVNVEMIETASATINTISLGWIDMFMSLAQIIFFVILALELMKEALNIAQGKEHNLVGKLLRYGMVGVLIGLAPGIMKAFQKIPLDTLDLIEFDRAAAEEQFKALMRMYQEKSFLGQLWSSAKDFMVSPLTLLSQLMYYVASIITTMTYVIYVFIFNVVLALAPVAFPFLLSDDLKEIFLNWITNVLSYTLTFPLLALGINIVVTLQLELVNIKQDGDGNLNFFQIAIMGLTVAMSATGIIFAAAKTAKNLTGSGGGGEAAAAGFAMAVSTAVAAAKMTAGVATGNFASAGKAAAQGVGSMAGGPEGQVMKTIGGGGASSGKVGTETLASQGK
jgi:hypothetical protein